MKKNIAVIVASLSLAAGAVFGGIAINQSNPVEHCLKGTIEKYGISKPITECKNVSKADRKKVEKIVSDFLFKVVPDDYSHPAG